MAGGDVAVQKALPSILDRFKAMVKERDEEIGVSPDDEAPPPTSDEIVRMYQQVLSELTFNSKPIITDLTIIAGDQREHGEGIADAICARILEVPVEQKLPSLYLLDSIVKNIGREYITHFSSRLPEVFCEAYRQVHPNLYTAMRHLFGTWSTVFPTAVLRKIEAQLQFSPSATHQSSGLASLRASESPRPTHGIHVNPKYLEARRQFEHPTMDSNNHRTRGSASTLNIYGKKTTSGYDEYDSDNIEVMSSQVGGQRLSATGHADGTSFSLGAEKTLPSAAARIAKSTPFRTEHGRSLSPPSDGFAVDNSPRRVVERASPSRLGFEYGVGRMKGREESSDRPRNFWSGGTYRRLETTAQYNGDELDGPRALIDAYGSDQRRPTPNNRTLKVDINGIDNKLGTKTWQNTEEEEFDWEDMSPTLVDRSRGHDLLASSVPPLESLTVRPAYGAHGAVPSNIDFRRSNGSTQPQISMVHDSSIVLEDVVQTSGRVSSSKSLGLRDGKKQFLGSQHPLEAQNIPHHLAQSSQHRFNVEGNPRNLHSLASSVGDRKPLVNKLPDADPRLRGSTNVGSRMGVPFVDPWKKSDTSAATIGPSTGAWPPAVQKSHPLPIVHPFPPREQNKSQPELMNAGNEIMIQGLKESFLPEIQSSNTTENKEWNSLRLPSFPRHQAGPIRLNLPNIEKITSAQPPLLLSQEGRQNLVLPAPLPPTVSIPSFLPSLAPGYTLRGHNAAVSGVPSNPVAGVPILNAPGSSMHLQGGGLPPLPSVPRPPSQMAPISQNPVANAPITQSGGALSGLINSLMAQGLISLRKQAPVQDSVGLEFNPDILKVRHESAITALYSDLPRQCTTCGLRFKCQELHSSHMDWHVTKNRLSRNRKQKPSRKWFVSVNMWLTGTEALGTDAIPGFLPAESVAENKDDEEFAVPADEDQNVCALCGEPFDDFYSDETEEWMYKGAVYMNAPGGSTAGMDRSQLGPIVHAKCRSESNVVAPQDFRQDEGGYTEEGSQRKRLRIAC
ncbi:hypothetical protein NMG60_11009790 [Bertholletia excelsa]